MNLSGALMPHGNVRIRAEVAEIDEKDTRHIAAFFTKVKEKAHGFILYVTSKADVASEATTFGSIVV